jgi:hypothetical protein
MSISVIKLSVGVSVNNHLAVFALLLKDIIIWILPSDIAQVWDKRAILLPLGRKDRQYK